MTTPFAVLLENNWPVMLAAHGEPVVFTDSEGTAYNITGVVNPRQDVNTLDVTWEMQARQAEIQIAAEDLSGVVFSPRQDTILARGVTYTVIDHQDLTGAVYKFLCERVDLLGVQHRGRARR